MSVGNDVDHAREDSVDLDHAMHGRSTADLVDILVPSVSRTLSGSDQRVDRRVEMTVTLPGMGRQDVSLIEAAGISGTVPVFNDHSVPVDQFEYAVWLGTNDRGDSITTGFIFEDNQWNTLGIDIRLADEPDRYWTLQPGRDALEEVRYDPQAHHHDPGEHQLEPPPGYEADGATPHRPEAHTATPTGRIAGMRAPAYPIPSGGVEARTADIVAFAANDVTPAEALWDAVAGVAHFNTSMNNSHSTSWPISDVSIRLVGVGTINDDFSSDMVDDYNDVYSRAENIRSGLGADLAIVVFPQRWTSNGTGGAACGGWPYYGTVGLIVVSSADYCDQGTKYGVAHEVGHAYDLYHHDVTAPLGYNRARRVSSSLETLMVNTVDGRSLQVSNPEVRFLTNSSYWSGTSTRDNARRIHEVATTIRDRETFAASASTAPGRYVPLVSPVRVLHTQQGIGGYTTPMTSTPRPVGLMAQGIPAAANAVVVNITAVGAAGNGNVQVNSSTTFPSNPKASVANYRAGVNKATGAIVTPGEYGLLYVKIGGAQTDLIVDVMGYFTPNGGVGLHVQTPVRVCNTTNNTGGCGTARLGPGNTTKVVTTGCANGSTAAAVNLTAASPISSGNLRVAATSSGFSNSSVLNFSTTSGSIGNFSIVPLHTDETFAIKANTGSTHLQVDLMGCFGSGGLDYRPLATPIRLRDTRPTGGPGGTDWQTANEIEPITTQQTNTVALLNITVTNASATGRETAYPSTASAPSTSSINYSTAQPNINNFAIVDGGTDANIKIKRGPSGGGNYLVVDQYGWFE